MAQGLGDRGNAARWALWVLPLAFVALLIAMRQVSLPFWQNFNLDPDYYYLLNGLRLAEGLAPTDISHPGTPVQALIAATIHALFPALSSAERVGAVLDQPEHVLVVATSVIYGLVGLSLWGLGRAVYSLDNLLWPALLAQSAPFLSRLIPKFGLHPKPEPFLIIAAALLVAALVPMLKPGRPQDRHAALAGMAVALGVACKIHFVLLGVLPLLLLDRRRFAIYVGAGAVALVVFVAPALASWHIWTDWITRMSLHSGAYGEGAATIVDTARYPRAVLKLFASKLVMSLGLVASVVALAAYFRLRRRGLIPQDKAARLLLGIMVAQVLVVLTTAKQPAAHYLVPALLLTGPALALLWRLSRPMLGQRVHFRLWAGLSALLLLAQAPQMVAQARELRQWTQEQFALDMARFDGCAKVFFDSASAQSYAFQRGDMNALARYSPLLESRFPADEYTWFTNDHTYWKRGLMQWNRPVSLDDILARHGCAVFRGNQPWTFEAEISRLKPGLAFTDHCRTGDEDIYTIGTTCAGKTR